MTYAREQDLKCSLNWAFRMSEDLRKSESCIVSINCSSGVRGHLQDQIAHTKMLRKRME